MKNTCETCEFKPRYMPDVVCGHRINDDDGNCTMWESTIWFAEIEQLKKERDNWHTQADLNAEARSVSETEQIIKRLTRFNHYLVGKNHRLVNALQWGMNDFFVSGMKENITTEMEARLRVLLVNIFNRAGMIDENGNPIKSPVPCITKCPDCGDKLVRRLDEKGVYMYDYCPKCTPEEKCSGGIHRTTIVECEDCHERFKLKNPVLPKKSSIMNHHDYPWHHHSPFTWTKEDDAFVKQMIAKQNRRGKVMINDICEHVFAFLLEHGITIPYGKRLDQIDLFAKLEEVVDTCCKQTIVCPVCSLVINVSRNGFEYEQKTISHAPKGGNESGSAGYEHGK